VILQTLSNVSSPAYAQIATSIHLNLTQLLKSSKHYQLLTRAIGANSIASDYIQTYFVAGTRC